MDVGILDVPNDIWEHHILPRCDALQWWLLASTCKTLHADMDARVRRMKEIQPVDPAKPLGYLLRDFPSHRWIWQSHFTGPWDVALYQHMTPRLMLYMGQAAYGTAWVRSSYCGIPDACCQWAYLNRATVSDADIHFILDFLMPFASKTDLIHIVIALNHVPILNARFGDWLPRFAKKDITFNRFNLWGNALRSFNTRAIVHNCVDTLRYLISINDSPYSRQFNEQQVLYACSVSDDMCQLIQSHVHDTIQLGSWLRFQSPKTLKRALVWYRHDYEIPDRDADAFWMDIPWVYLLTHFSNVERAPYVRVLCEETPFLDPKRALDAIGAHRLRLGALVINCQNDSLAVAEYNAIFSAWLTLYTQLHQLDTAAFIASIEQIPVEGYSTNAELLATVDMPPLYQSTCRR